MIDKLKTWLYELWYGHPFLLSEEVHIICETRDDPKFKHLNDYEIQKLVKIRIKEMYRKYKIMKRAKMKRK